MTNYEKFKAIMKKHHEDPKCMSITFTVNLVGEMNDVLNKHPDNYETILEERDGLVQLLGHLKTDEKCYCCGGPLYLSDVQGYDFVCPHCDESF